MTYPRVEKQRQVVCTNTQAVKPKTASSNTAHLLSFKNTQNNTGLSIEHTTNPNQQYAQSYVRVKSKDGKTYNFNATLEKRINNVTAKLQKAEKENGLIGKAWSWTKNTIGFGDSSNKVRELQANERKLLAQFNSNEKTRANVFKQLTGCEYNEENLEKFIKGQIKLKSEIAIEKYKEGQEKAVDITSDIVSGVVAYGTAAACIAGGIAAAPFTAGASLGAVAVGVGIAAGTGAATKVAIKGGEAAVGGKKYSLKQAGKDATIGAVSGALAPVTIGAGGAVANSVGKVAPKFIATTARFAVEGGTFGAVDGGTRSALEGDSVGDIALNTLKGAGVGALAGNVLGHSGNALGTISKSILKTNNTKIHSTTVSNKSINTVKTKLDNVLSSEYCPMPDYMSRIPKDYSEEKVVAKLAQMFEDSKFFSRVSTCEETYGKNFEFAKMMGRLSKSSTESISEGKSFEEVLKQIAKGYSNETTINTKYTERIGCSGIYRGSTETPKYCGTFRTENRLITGYGRRGDKGLYIEYTNRLEKGFNLRKSPYEGFTITECHSGVMKHPYSDEVAKNMKIISEKYNIFQCLVKKYKIVGKLSTKQREQADDIIAEIYYLMANTMPFRRGSNGISDVLMRSQYSALGINKPHLKQGIGLDLEAFCMNLDEYKIKWNSFFEL